MSGRRSVRCSKIQHRSNMRSCALSCFSGSVRKSVRWKQASPRQRFTSKRICLTKLAWLHWCPRLYRRRSRSRISAPYHLQCARLSLMHTQSIQGCRYTRSLECAMLPGKSRARRCWKHSSMPICLWSRSLPPHFTCKGQSMSYHKPLKRLRGHQGG